jgi:hypothetical protein
MDTKNAQNVYVSSHKGHIWGKRRINDYEIWKNGGKKFVKISLNSIDLSTVQSENKKNKKILKEICKIENFLETIESDDITSIFEDTLKKLNDFKNNINKELDEDIEVEKQHTLVDFEYFEKVKGISWFKGGSGYCQGMIDDKQTYLHHLIMDFQGSGKGFQKVSIDHINRDPLDNRKQNLRLATCDEQKQNSKGQLEGTKRNRKNGARPLPDGLTQEDLPKYVVYYTEKYGPEDKKVTRDFFRIEKHPAQLCENPKFKNKWATSKSMKNYSIIRKLIEVKTKIREMDQSLLEPVNA